MITRNFVSLAHSRFRGCSFFLKLTLLSLMFPLSASATITDYGSYFHDSDTGLYWLKLTETRSMSYDDLADELRAAGALYGWRYAKLEELEVFIEAYGYAPNNGCQFGNYCKNVSRPEKLENLIRLFGDNYDAALDESNSTYDIHPNGMGRSFGYVGERGDVPGTTYYQHVYTAEITDREEINRSTGLPSFDYDDRIVIRTSLLPGGSAFLVRNTDPSVPLDDPNDPNTLELTLFDNLLPEDAGLTVPCNPDPYDPYGGGPCTYDVNQWNAGAILDYAGILNWGDFSLYATSAFDKEARPWVRLTSHDYAQADGCEAGDTDLGDNWCRKDTSDAAFVLITPSGYIPGSYLRYGEETSIDYTGGFSLDNVDLEFIHSNIQIDYEPWDSANTIRPKEEYFITVGVKTLSVLDGDPIDFDASTIDPATVKLGPARASNNALPINNDFDGDGDLDAVFGFRMEDTGLTCFDTSITFVAQTFGGDALADQDTVVPINCEEIIEMDIDPFNPVNTIRPNDNYNVTVAIMGMRVSDGDEQDVTPGSGTGDDIDTTSLRFGPAQTGAIGSPIISDYNGDSLDDVLVTFNVFDAGIACEDTELDMIGEKLSGIEVKSTDSIVTEDCEAGSCHP